MFKKLLKSFSLMALSISTVFGMNFAMVAAQDTGELNCGAQGNLTGTNCESSAGADNTINATVKRAIQIFQVIVGIISVFMLIFGGLKYITSGGESSNISAAKNTILFAIIGLIVVALAQVIVQFALNRASAPAGQI